MKALPLAIQVTRSHQAMGRKASRGIQVGLLIIPQELEEMGRYRGE